MPTPDEFRKILTQRNQVCHQNFKDDKTVLVYVKNYLSDYLTQQPPLQKVSRVISLGIDSQILLYYFMNIKHPYLG